MKSGSVYDCLVVSSYVCVCVIKFYVNGVKCVPVTQVGLGVAPTLCMEINGPSILKWPE